MKFMKKINAKFFLVPVLIIISAFAQGDSDIYFKMNKSIDIFGKIYREISLNYVDAVDPEIFMKAGIEGMLAALDPYTNYYDEQKQEDIEIITNGKYGGVGATIGIRNKKVIVVDLIEGYSAYRQGIMIGDEIVNINGVDVNEKNYSTISSLIKGEAGTEVVLVIQREGNEEKMVFNLLREEIEIKNLSYYGFYPEKSDNVYLKLTSFSRTAGDEIKKALIELKEKGDIKSIVLDLRGNPGGLLDAAVDVAEKFVESNSLIVSVIGRDSTDLKKFNSKEKPLAGDIKLVVLIDQNSASASEIVAGAIQDHDRGVILGTKSFGKGLVQTIIPVTAKTSLKMTTAKYYTPSGRCIQKIDYSNHNLNEDRQEVIDSIDYFTGNKRIVKGAGGISPDTLVSNTSESDQVTNLLARGMFFKFATNYFNTTNPETKLSTSQDQLFEKFLTYLKTQEFEYTSKIESLAKQLEKEAEEFIASNKEISLKTKEILSEIEKEKQNELIKFKGDILAQINEEIAARKEGRKGRIEESLKYDKQFAAAVSVIKKEKKYNKFLKIKD